MHSIEKNNLSNILLGCKKNNLKSQSALYKLFYSYAMSVCLRYTTNEEEAVEILNDSFLKVFKKIKQQNDSQSFKPWLRRILINTAIDYHRKYKKIKFDYNISDMESEVIADDFTAQIAADEIITLIKNLPSSYRLVFNLYVIEGYSHKEIAKQLNISESTSRAHLSVANARLRHMLSKKNDEKRYVYKR